MRTIHYFAGANTAQGFYTCFDDILPSPLRRRMYYLKGGPGVGKSTLMRRVGEAAEKAGLAVEYFYCSSDPDSLDGVCLPERGAALMDGTSPHVYDPVVPGARDTLVSLGDFLDETGLKSHSGDIIRVQQAISERFRRCYRYLAAARQVLAAVSPGREDQRRTCDLALEWSGALPLRGGAGSVRRLFAAAYTPKGRVDLLNAMGIEHRLTIDCPFGLAASGLMRMVAERAVARGLHVVELLDPLCPDQVSHVTIPAHGIAFCTGRRGSAQEGEWVDAAAVFQLDAPSDKEQSFDRNAYELLLQRATEQLASAKTLHDELESYYVGHMDFIKWQTCLDRILLELELG